MKNILFIVTSSNIHSYGWNTIEYLSKEWPQVSITIYVDDKMKAHKLSFSKFTNRIDSRFSNFKKEGFNIINIHEELANTNNISITHNVNDLKIFDWIILENKKDYQTEAMLKHTKQGFLTLDISKKIIVNATIAAPALPLNILIWNTNSTTWTVVESHTLKKEFGFTNNAKKLTFSYPIYLTRFLNNYTEAKVFSKSSLKPNETCNFFSIYTYYSKLIFTILKRQLYKKDSNWKLIISKSNITTAIEQPKKSFWADPFVIKKDDDVVVYFEELKKESDGLGRISAIVLDQNFKIKNRNIVLDTDYHLSFPNVFIKDNTYYMIPESSQKNCLQLYECTKFPFEWNFKMNLMENIKLLDAIWVYHNNLYWIFANKIESFEYDNNERLYLYHAENLFSNDWKPHIQNPIITNASLARNAGNIFFKDGKMFRVSQKCLNGYGENLVINEIKKLSVEEYIEEKINEIFPMQHEVGMHTMNTYDDLTVYDVLKQE